MRSTFRALRHRDYRLYWSSMLVSNIGTWMQQIAQLWLVLVVLEGGARATGITMGLQFVPFLLVAPFGGLLADRLPKRSLLIFTNAFMGSIGLALGVLTLTDVAQIWHAYVLAFLLGVGKALDNPARQSFVSELVGQDDLPNAIALNSTSFNAARLIGPGVAGLLIHAIGTGWVFMINGLTFASPIIALILLRSRPAAGAQQGTGTVLSRMLEGVGVVRSRPDLLMIMLVAFGLGTFGMNFEMTMALMATEVYDKGAGEYGLLGSVLAVGTLTGALMSARRKYPRRRLIVGGAAVFGLVEIAAALMPSYVLFAIALAPLGFITMTVLISANTYVQTTVPQQVRGRVLALYMMILMGGKPVGAPVVGWVADVFGAPWSFIGGGVLTIAFALVALVFIAPRSGIVVRPRFRPRPGLAVIVDMQKKHRPELAPRPEGGAGQQAA
ncbi:MFS transporter [Phytoactinopolyspora halotolerans]|uniref:MFS transporter n=1 Tax=Phytoactinopolyspora halotolerans TaxID=1981512 RepID=A0A6L9S4L0_9ACTN|nr:MFS transporter [Phytoactinopolyspora halotolerans]NED98959.1 MFS transporter [Phytoactinopolyspora halotolerans]